MVADVYVNLTTGLVSEDSGAFYRIGIVYGRGSHVEVPHYSRIRKVGRDKQAKQERPKSIRSQRRKQTQFADYNLTLFFPDIFLTVSM